MAYFWNGVDLMAGGQFQALLSKAFNFFNFYSFTLTSTGAGWANLNARWNFPAASLTGMTKAFRVRLTLNQGTMTGSVVGCYIGAGAGGGSHSFDGTQVQVKWNGSGTPSLVSGGGDIVSDIIVYPFDPSKDFVLSLTITPDGPPNAAGVPLSGTRITGVPEGPSSTTVSGGAVDTGSTPCIYKIELGV